MNSFLSESNVFPTSHLLKDVLPKLDRKISSHQFNPPGCTYLCRPTLKVVLNVLLPLWRYRDILVLLVIERVVQCDINEFIMWRHIEVTITSKMVHMLCIPGLFRCCLQLLWLVVGTGHGLAAPICTLSGTTCIGYLSLVSAWVVGKVSSQRNLFECGLTKICNQWPPKHAELIHRVWYHHLLLTFAWRHVYSSEFHP